MFLPGTVAVVTGDVQSGLATDLHLSDALVPACSLLVLKAESALQRATKGVDFGRRPSLPLITWPTPILVTKSPRPTELSNLVAEDVVRLCWSAG